MDLTRFEPMSPMRELQERMSRLLGDAFGSYVRPGYPSLDAYETDDEIVVKADLPGVEPENLDVHVTERSVTIRGEVKQERTREEGYLHSERRYGAFQRTIPLSTPVDPDRARADYTHGVLHLRLPKKEPTQGRKLDIRAD